MPRYIGLFIILFTGLLIQASAAVRLEAHDRATPTIDRWRSPLAIASSLSLLCQHSANPQIRPILLDVARRDLDRWQPDSGLEGIKAELRQGIERLQAAKGYEAGIATCVTVGASLESIHDQARQDGLADEEISRVFDEWQSE